MILPRHYDPKEGDIIYHYCNCAAFAAIIDSGSLWFSDINSMNDLLEGQWGYRKFEKVASKLLKQVGKKFLDAFDEIYASMQSHSLPLVASFSLDGDVLSQWVRYADDGSGFAIGLDAQHMASLAARPLVVTYDEDVQEKEFEQLLLGCYKFWNEQKEQFVKDDFGFIVSCAVDTHAYKNPAFREEKEVRLVHLIGVRFEKDSIKLEGTGGTSHGEEIPAPEVKFRFVGSLLRPYVALGFRSQLSPTPIRQVILGPKNLSKAATVAMLMTKHGYSGFSIRRSKASYG